MAAAPISNDVFHVSRSALDESATTLAAIDRGGSLTKAVYVSKDGEGDTATHYALHCVVFANSDFEDCLHFLKEKALLSRSGSIRVTGVGCEMHKDVIEKILGLKVEFLDEFLTMFRGTYFFLSNLEDRESAFYPPTPIDSWIKIEQPSENQVSVDKMMGNITRNNGPDPNALFPCVYVVIGSGTLVIMINAEGKTKICGFSLIGGKALMGIGRALAGTANYDELLEMAKNGNCGNVDTTVGDLSTKEDPDAPYGQFPPQVPFYSFGKLVDHKEELSEYSMEDRAASVVHLVAMNTASLIGSAMAQEGVTRVVVGGHGARGEAIRSMMFNHLQMFISVPIDMKFLKTGATGAVGAMIAKPEDPMNFMM